MREISEHLKTVYSKYEKAREGSSRDRTRKAHFCRGRNVI